MKDRRPAEVRGARDLAALWRALPAAALCYPASALASGVGIAELSSTLRARAWRDHCCAPSVASCVDMGRNCALGATGRCRADALFPASIGGGTAKWRMATLFLQWRPTHRELNLLALGDAACEEIGWAAHCLRERYGIEPTGRFDVERFADLELPEASRWGLRFLTPWIVAKQIRAKLHAPDAEAVAYELGKAMLARAVKFTALCSRDATLQRLGGHLVHHVADALLPTTLTVDEVNIAPKVRTVASVGNTATFRALTWEGEATLWVDSTLLPWLSLLAVCGGGENADKGFGGVELMPLR